MWGSNGGGCQFGSVGRFERYVLAPPPPPRAGHGGPFEWGGSPGAVGVRDKRPMRCTATGALLPQCVPPLPLCPSLARTSGVRRMPRAKGPPPPVLTGAVLVVGGPPVRHVPVPQGPCPRPPAPVPVPAPLLPPPLSPSTAPPCRPKARVQAVGWPPLGARKRGGRLLLTPPPPCPREKGRPGRTDAPQQQGLDRSQDHR